MKLLLFSLCLSLWPLACTDGPDAGLVGSDQNPAVRVLFVGNSYTYENNLPAFVEAIGADQVDIETGMIVAGGATLARHWSDGRAAKEIRGGNWDYVVLQEQSTLGRTRYINGATLIADPAEFHQAARAFGALAEQHGVQALLLATWPRKAYPEQLATIHNAYTMVGRELEIPVIPVGVAWVRLADMDPSWELYGEDGSHPGPDGTFTTATMIVQQVLHGSIPSIAAAVRVELMDGRGKPRGEFLRTDLSPEREALLTNVLLALKQELTAAGGYLDLPAVAQPDRPTRSAGEPLDLDSLVGKWRGETSLLAGYPSLFEFTIEPAATGVDVRLHVEHHLYGDVLEEPAESTRGHLDNDRFVFEHSTTTFGDGKLRYDLALVSGELVGVVEYGNLQAPFICSDLQLSPVSSIPTPIQETSRVPGSLALAEVSLEDMAWLEGHWQADALGGKIDEVWLPAMEDSMQAVFRSTSEGALRFSEFIQVTAEDDGIIMRFRHFRPDYTTWEGNGPPMELALKSARPRELVFEAHNDSSPDRIVYRQVGEELHVTVTGLDEVVVFHRASASQEDQSDLSVYSVVAQELIAMEARDQELNWLVVNGAPEAHDEGFAARKAKLYASNTSRAAEIFDEIGYPSSDLVGTDGEHAFWLVVQHSDQRPEFQVRVAKAMHAIVLAGGAGGDRLAMLVDRVRINTDRPQVFGSQVRYELETGRALPKALEDPRAVDARRAEVGLKPLWQYMNEMCELQFRMNEIRYRELGVEVPWVYPEGYTDW